MTTNDKEYSSLYGPLATISEYKRGETVTYHDYAQSSGRNSGHIIWIVAATDPDAINLYRDTRHRRVSGANLST